MSIEQRVRVVARRAARRCATRTVGHHSCGKMEARMVVPWQSSAVASVIADACREAIKQDRKLRLEPINE